MTIWKLNRNPKPKVILSVLVEMDGWMRWVGGGEGGISHGAAGVNKNILQRAHTKLETFYEREHGFFGEWKNDRAKSRSDMLFNSLIVKRCMTLDAEAHKTAAAAAAANFTL